MIETAILGAVLNRIRGGGFPEFGIPRTRFARPLAYVGMAALGFHLFGPWGVGVALLFAVGSQLGGWGQYMNIGSFHQPGTKGDPFNEVAWIDWVVARTRGVQNVGDPRDEALAMSMRGLYFAPALALVWYLTGHCWVMLALAAFPASYWVAAQLRIRGKLGARWDNVAVAEYLWGAAFWGAAAL